MNDNSKPNYARRCQQLQTLMRQRGIDVVLLTTEPEFLYFCGFATPFWKSPTRSWFLLLRQSGAPIAIVPTIGESLINRCYIEKAYGRQSPHPSDEGIELLASQLTNGNNNTTLTIGIMQGRQSYLRLPQSDYQQLQTCLPMAKWVDVTPEVHAIRHRKEAVEIQKIKQVCEIVCDAFDNIDNWLTVGMTSREIHRRFKIDCLARGVDDVAYLVGGLGNGGYRDIISPPDDTLAQVGDVLMLDVGCVIDGYFCDFDRNFVIGQSNKTLQKAYQSLWQSTEVGLQTAKHGMKCSDVFAAMYDVLATAGYTNNTPTATTPRFGHGLGIELTETPSLTSWDNTVLETGMVITLEPSLDYGDGFVMVHEENIAIEANGCQLLTRRAPQQFPILTGGL